MMKLRSKPVIILSGIVILGFLLRIFVWAMDPTVARDGVLYIDMAEAWYHYGDYETMLEKFIGREWIPFWVPWLMTLLMGMGLSGQMAGVCLVIGLGSLIPLIVYKITDIVCEKKEIALGAALLAAVHPGLIEMSIEILRDTPYLFFAGISIFLFLNAIKYRKWWQWALGGLVLAMAIFTRYESCELLILAIGYLAVAPLLKWEKWWNSGIFLGCLLTSFLIGILLIYWMADISPQENLSRYWHQIRQVYMENFKNNLM